MKNKQLTPEQHHICIERGTEAPFTGKYLYNSEKGTYNCVVCGNPLFSSETKFEAESNTGWPSFYDVLKKGTVKFKEDRSFGMIRTEVVCANCDAHLGHVFEDGPKDKTGLHYCINSAALDFASEK
jgi:peptide-methionine (R)-S-oxide reductase